MGRRRQPPKLLSRVIRAVAGLNQSKGVTSGNIANHVRKQLNISGKMTQTCALQIKRALKYAVEIGALTVKYGKYKMASRRQIIPIDSLELALDYRKKTRQARKAKQKRKRSSSDSTRKKKKKKHEQPKCNKKDKSNNKKKQNLLEKKEIPPETPNSAETERSEIPDSHRIPTPHDQTEQLEKRRKQSGTETSYPKYGDVMTGDDKKSLTKVPQKPRRPRPPILPSGRGRTRSADSYKKQEGNEKRARSSKKKQRCQRCQNESGRKYLEDGDSMDDEFEEYIQKIF